MYNLAIIEDDVNFSALLKRDVLNFARENGLSFNISEFGSIEEFLVPRYVRYDIVFFDIELPGMNGLEGAKRFRQSDADAIIIFMTNLSRFAVNGYEVDAMDYVVKPISYNNLALKLQKAIQKLNHKQYKTVVVNAKDGVYILRSIDILYVEISGHTLTFHTDNGVASATGNLSSYEDGLKGYHFSRCNSCYLVNMQAIVKIDGMSIWLRDGTELSISRRKKKEFFDDFTQYIGK